MNKLTLLTWLILLPLSPSLSGQEFLDHIDNDWPNSRYIVHGDGTVTDTATSLMWRQCAGNHDYNANTNACSGGSSNNVMWHNALLNASNYDDGTYSDWRLPNIKELESILAYDRTAPTVNIDIFPHIDNIYSGGSGTYTYWSSTPKSASSSDDYSMSVRFDLGTVGYNIRDKTSVTYIMVRDAE